MDTTYEQKLHDLNLDEGLMSLILSKVSKQETIQPFGREGVGLEILRFLEEQPEHAREAANAGDLPREVREVIAIKLAHEFLERSPAAPQPIALPEGKPSTDAPGASPPRPDPVSSPYRAVFGCGYERTHVLFSGEVAGEDPRERGGEENAEIPDQ